MRRHLKEKERTREGGGRGGRRGEVSREGEGEGDTRLEEKDEAREAKGPTRGGWGVAFRIGEERDGIEASPPRGGRGVHGGAASTTVTLSTPSHAGRAHADTVSTAASTRNTGARGDAGEGEEGEKELSPSARRRRAAQGAGGHTISSTGTTCSCAHGLPLFSA